MESMRGVDLVDTHTSPSTIKAHSIFEIISAVVNNSPSIITFSAGEISYIISLIQIETRRTSFSSWSEFQNNISSIYSPTKIASVTLHYRTENCPAAQRHKTIGIHNKFLALK
ncbi:MAG: hypothetical protein WBP64_13520 [Nitrososphaeraceae archaeon]